MARKPTSSAIYTELNAKIELMSKWSYIILVKVCLVGIFLPLLLLTIVNYFVFQLGEESFYLPFPMLWVCSIVIFLMFNFNANLLFCAGRLPFNWKTPIGYFVALATEYAYCYCTLMGFSPIFGFFLGSAWLASTFAKDITNDVIELSSISKTSRKKNGKELKKRFWYIIRFYSDAKQLS